MSCKLHVTRIKKSIWIIFALYLLHLTYLYLCIISTSFEFISTIVGHDFCSSQKSLSSRLNVPVDGAGKHSFLSSVKKFLFYFGFKKKKTFWYTISDYQVFFLRILKTVHCLLFLNSLLYSNVANEKSDVYSNAIFIEIMFLLSLATTNSYFVFTILQF
jgi:hypothetical protein